MQFDFCQLFNTVLDNSKGYRYKGNYVFLHSGELMKILYSNDQFFPNNETDAEQIMQTVPNLAAAGADVVFMFPGKRSGKLTTVEDLSAYYQVKGNFGVSTRKSIFFPSPRFFEKYSHALYTAFTKQQRDADVLYTRNIPTVLATLIFTKTPVVYETFRPWPDQLFFMPYLFRMLGKNRRFLGAVLHSKYASDSYMRTGVPSEKLFPIHNGYDPDRIKPVLDKKTAREKLNLPQDRRIVVYAGNVSVGKGLGIMQDIADTMKDTLFIIVGSKGRGEIEERAEKQDNVKIVPWQTFDATVPYLYAADVLFIPPTCGPLKKVGNTVLPIKTFLYMAVGRAIFAPSSPDLVELLTHNENAYLVEPDNIEKAKTSMKTLIEDEELVKKLGETAKQQSLGMTYEKRSSRIVDFIKTRLEST